MKKILALVLASVLLACCGCSGNETAVVEPGKTEKPAERGISFTLALNPSVTFADGKVDSLRNSAASAMQTDVNSEEPTALYNSTSWQWLYQDGTGWDRRAIRSLSQWTNGNTVFKNGMPYTYMFDDNNVSSMMVYDSSKMEIEGINSGEIPESGIALTFTQGSEEALCYTAKEDCEVILSDVDGGNIAVVKSIEGEDTSFIGQSGAMQSVILRIYKNNRIYWQEVLDSSTTAVEFPHFEAIELSEGDSLLITAEATDNTEDIVRGNCDIPAETKTVTRQVGYTTTNEYQTTPPPLTEIPLVVQSQCPFILLYSENATDEEQEIIEAFSAGMEEALGVTIECYSESNYTGNDTTAAGDQIILIGNTSFNDSKTALKEIQSKRANNAADFIIRYVNNKVVIAACDSVGLELATEFFLNNYCVDDDAKIPADLNYVSSNFNPLKNIKLAGTPISEYKLVLSRFASFMEVSAADYLVDQIAKATGYVINSVRDSESVSDNEIVIGNTSRNSPDHSQRTDSGTSEKYSVSVKSGRTVITGDSIAAINAGAIFFAGELIKNEGLSAGYDKSGSYDGEYSLTDGYKLVWSDEFNGTQLGKTWITTRRSNPSVYGGRAYVSSKNTYVEDGNLVQKISREGNDVVEADINSQGPETAKFKYGYFEFRARLSPVVGSWGAVWLIGDPIGDIMSEIDVFENFGVTNMSKTTLHIWGPGSNHDAFLTDTGYVYNYKPGTNIPEMYADNYHTMGVNWQRGRFDFYVDGVCTNTFIFDPEDSKYDCYDSTAHIILSHWGGENIPEFANCILPDDFSEAYIYYDWIRIYQKDDDDSIMYVKK